MMWNADGWWGYGMMGFGWLIPLALLAVIVWAVVSWTRSGGPVREAPANGARALDILKERYARGELTKEEFESMRHDIE